MVEVEADLEDLDEGGGAGDAGVVDDLEVLDGEEF